MIINLLVLFEYNDMFIWFIVYRSIMKSFEMYFMNKQYARVKELGDKLAEINPLIDWGFSGLLSVKCMITGQSVVLGLILMKLS